MSLLLTQVRRLAFGSTPRTRIQLGPAPRRQAATRPSGSCAGCGAYKRWDPHRYAIVADQLIQDYAAQIVFTWGGRELDTVNEIIEKMKYRAHIACETKSLGQLAEIFRHCDLYIGGDTGPMHLAAFMKVPVVAIFGPTDCIVNAPYKKTQHIIIRKEVACSPCRVRDCKKRDCMKAIQDDDVIQAARLILNAGKLRHDVLPAAAFNTSD